MTIKRSSTLGRSSPKNALENNLHVDWTLRLTGEEVVVVLPQLEGALKQLPGTLPGIWAEAGPHVLHALLGVRVEEHHYGIPLGVVQPVHRVWRDVQHCMLILHQGGENKVKNSFSFRNCRYYGN